MFTDFFADWDSMVHEITNHRRRAWRRQGRDRAEYVDLVRDGTTKMHNCNFFDVDAEGKLSRVIIWMDGANPLT